MMHLFQSSKLWKRLAAIKLSAQSVPNGTQILCKIFYPQDVPTEHASQTLRPVRDVLWVEEKIKLGYVPYERFVLTIQHFT